MEASEKRKTNENTILISGHKDEMSKIVKSYEKELHVLTIVLCVPIAHIGFLFRLSKYLDWHRGEKMNMVHGCSRIEQRVCGMELVIEELFYPKEAVNVQTYATSLDISDELVERLLVKFQDTSIVTHYYVNDLWCKYSMSKTTPKEKEQGYGIRANNDPSERKFSIFRDDLSHMGNASVYVASEESQSREDND